MTIRSHILIVEDDPLVAEVLQTTLEEHYRVSCAHTIGQALGFLRTGHFSAVLLDCVLPDGRGDHVADFAETNGTPVIEMSGYPSEISGLHEGHRPHLQKPFGAALLLSTIDMVLADERAGRAQHEPRGGAVCGTGTGGGR